MSNEDDSPHASGRVYRFDDVRIDARAAQVWKDNQPLHLEPKGFQLLCFLIENRGGLIEKQQLLDAVWGDTFVTENAMTRVVAQLRKALGDEAKAAKYIETVPKRGYRFVAEVEEEAQQGTTATATKKGWWVWIAAAVGVSAVAAGLWVNSARERPTPPTTMPLTSYSGMENDPSLSPDGSFLAFTRWEESSTRDLYVQQIGGGDPLAIHVGEGDTFTPAWSPDGVRIAFIRHIEAEDGAPTDAIFVVPSLGGAEREIGVFRIPRHGLSWSPDGELLALSHQDTPDSASRIYVLSLETAAMRALTAPPLEVTLGDWNPRFSPNGDTVAFVRGGEDGSDIYVVSVDGGEERRLTFRAAHTRGLDWTPDGESIVFSSGGPGRVGFWGLWRVSASGGEPKPLAVGEQGTSPTQSRQSGRLAYVRADMIFNVWRIPGPAAAPETRSPESLVASTALDYLPRYSPDGTTIAFTSSRSGTVELWLCDGDGSNPRQLTFFEAPVTIGGWWSPDSEQIAFWSTKEGSADIYVVSAAGGIPRRLTAKTSLEADPTWSRDGRWIYFTSNRTGRNEIWKMPAAGGEATQVTSNEGTVAFESPDGAYLYFAKQTPNGGPPGIWRIPVASGREELVLGDVGFGDWTVTESGIYYLNREAEPEPRWPIELFDVDTGEVSSVAVLEDYPLPFWISVSPDEEWILYTRADAVESDIMLVENFR